MVAPEVGFVIEEKLVYAYLKVLWVERAAPTKGQSSVEAVKLMIATFGLDVPIDSSVSARVDGGCGPVRTKETDGDGCHRST